MSIEESKSASAASRARSPYRTLALLSALTVVLAALAFLPSKARLSGRGAPLRAPIAVDEPVVHLYK